MRSIVPVRDEVASGGTHVDRLAPRIEHDPLGAVTVPDDVLYGPQTNRAIDNVALSATTVARMPHLIVAWAQVRKAAVRMVRGRGGERQHVFEKLNDAYALWPITR